MAEIKATQEEIEALAAVFLPPEQATKLKDLQIEDAALHAKYRGVPLSLELKITPRG